MNKFLSVIILILTIICVYPDVAAQSPEDIRMSRILNSVGKTEPLRLGDTSGTDIMGVLNAIDNKEALQEMTSLTRSVVPDESSDIMEVLSIISPADPVSTADAVITEYFSSPEVYEKNVVDGIFASMASDNILDYISKTYADDNYYSNGFWGKESQNATLSLYKGAIPKYDPEDFYRPVWGRITSNFGFRESFGRMHKGVDLALNIGDTVRAALPGIVGRVGYEPGGYGNFIVVAHSNGVETRYAHLQEAIVTPGQRIEAGSPIALGGNTGNSTGPHLHFEIRYMGTPMDPLAMFDFSGRNMNFAGRLDRQNSSNRFATGFSASKNSLQQKSTYVVRQGDTVKSIAKRAGITPLRLCQLNFITENTTLEPGTMLKLK